MNIWALPSSLCLHPEVLVCGTRLEGTYWAKLMCLVSFQMKQAENTTQQFSPECEEEIISCKGDWALEQIAKRGFGISLSGDTPKSSEHDPE